MGRRRVLRDAAEPTSAPDEAPGYVAVKYWPASEQPREKLEALGPGNLSTQELLAIILRVGRQGESVLAVAQRLLVERLGLAGVGSSSLVELAKVAGIGRVKAIEIQAALELGRRWLSVAPDQQREVRCPSDAAAFLMPEMQLLTREHLKAVLLNTKNRVVSMHTVYEGTVNSASVRVAEVFREAVRRDCPNLIVAHNHPSGDPAPSPEDVAVTRQIVQAGKLLEVAVLDHLIVGHGRWVSLKERGLGFS